LECLLGSLSKEIKGIAAITMSTVIVSPTVALLERVTALLFLVRA